MVLRPFNRKEPKMTKYVSAMLALMFASVASAQTPQPMTDVTAAEIREALEDAPPSPVVDEVLRITSTGELNVGIAIVRRTSADAGAAIHFQVTEIYQVIEGGGVILTGGTLIDAGLTRDLSALAVGPTAIGEGIAGGDSRHVATGDMVIIPAGTPHTFTEIDGSIIYTSTRVWQK